MILTYIVKIQLLQNVHNSIHTYATSSFEGLGVEDVLSEQNGVLLLAGIMYCMCTELQSKQ